MGPNRIFINQFNEYFKKINEELKRSFSSRIPIINDVGKHSLLGEGKRLRPLLFMLSCELFGYHGEDILHLSTIFEYLHTASLLHDDVMDNAELRRHKPSASHVWGNSAAVLTGDYLSSVCSSISASTSNMDFIKVIVDTGVRMSEGQALELMHTNDWNINKDQYMEIIISKTATLISAACTCGGIISGAKKDELENLSQFGLNLGIAFQLTDDLLDYTSSEDEFGKPVGKDLREGKITLPLIYTIANIEKEELERLENRFKNNHAKDEDYYQMITYVRNSGVIDEIRSEAQDYTNKAAGYLDFFEQSSTKDDLKVLNEYIVNRSF